MSVLLLLTLVVPMMLALLTVLLAPVLTLSLALLLMVPIVLTIVLALVLALMLPLVLVVVALAMALLLVHMSAVAAQQFGISSFNGAPMSDDHELHLALVYVDENISASVSVLQEHHSVEGHLKLRTGPNEGTAHRFDHSMPGELQVQDMVILVRQIMIACLESFII